MHVELPSHTVAKPVEAQELPPVTVTATENAPEQAKTLDEAPLASEPSTVVVVQQPKSTSSSAHADAVHSNAIEPAGADAVTPATEQAQDNATTTQVEPAEQSATAGNVIVSSNGAVIELADAADESAEVVGDHGQSEEEEVSAYPKRFSK